MTLVSQLAELLAPWQDLYNDSVPLATAVTTVHLVALVVGGGLAIAADRASLRLSGRGRPRGRCTSRRCAPFTGPCSSRSSSSS